MKIEPEMTLITGASSGIGFHLAHEFARNGHPLVLVAPQQDELNIGVRGFQQGNLMAPQDVAKAAYQGLADEDLLVVPGFMNKALVAARRILSESAQASVNAKFYEELPPDEWKRKRGDLESEAALRA